MIRPTAWIMLASFLALAPPAWGGSPSGSKGKMTPPLDGGPIPWERLDARASDLARKVVSRAIVAQEVSEIVYRSRKEVFEFLIDRPDFAAAVARALGIGRYRIYRNTDGFDADDGRGARGLLRRLYADAQRRVFYLEGRYDPPIFPSITGRLLLVLRTEHATALDGESYAEMRVAGYLRVDNMFLGFLMSIARSLSEAAVERKVRRFFRHVQKLSQRAYDDPQGLVEELTRHPELPQVTVDEFRQILLTPRPLAWAGSARFHRLRDLHLSPNGALFRG